MSIGKDYISFILDDNFEIKNFIAKISTQMFEHINSHPKSTFYLFYKYLTHSDLATFGKATRVNSLNKNLLYYIDENAMKNIEEKTNKPFQTAHQSCIGLKKRFYELCNLPNPREHEQYLLNDYCDVKILNNNLKYFTAYYTQKIFTKLDKHIFSESKRFWDFNDIDINISKGEYTDIQLHIAVHGIGMKCDTEFHKLRHHMFKGDTFILLFEDKHNLNEKNAMYILLEKNPIFFSLIGEINTSYMKYQELMRKRLIDKVLLKDNALDTVDIDDEVTRQQQQAWRKMLANEMMGYSQGNDEVFCPFTYITADFSKLGPLFVASHIKGFKDPNTTNEEKYDINNGLLLSANADALFDKHLISVDENKKLIFSFLLDDNYKLKAQLLLMNEIFKPILNEKRMEYLKYHRSEFERKEAERRSL